MKSTLLEGVNKLKNFILDLASGIKSVLDEPLVYGEYRKPLMFTGKRCKYSKLNNEVVEKSRLIEGSGEYKLYFSRYIPCKLISVFKNEHGWPEPKDGKYYFAAKWRNKDYSLIRDDFKLLGFSEFEAKKYILIFEAEKGEDGKFKLVDTSNLEKKNGKVDGKARDDRQLFISSHKKFDEGFWAIRGPNGATEEGRNGSIEWDKSLISIPVVLATNLAKLAAALVTMPFTLGGKKLMKRHDPIVKTVGYLLFTPVALLKHAVNIASTSVRAVTILPLVYGQKGKYGDYHKYCIVNDFKKYWAAAKRDYEFVRTWDLDFKKQDEQDYKTHVRVGTWKELDAKGPEHELDDNKKNDREKHESLKALDQGRSNNDDDVIKKDASGYETLKHSSTGRGSTGESESSSEREIIRRSRDIGNEWSRSR